MTDINEMTTTIENLENAAKAWLIDKPEDVQDRINILISRLKSILDSQSSTSN